MLKRCTPRLYSSQKHFKIVIILIFKNVNKLFQYDSVALFPFSRTDGSNSLQNGNPCVWGTGGHGRAALTRPTAFTDSVTSTVACFCSFRHCPRPPVPVTSQQQQQQQQQHNNRSRRQTESVRQASKQASKRTLVITFFLFRFQSKLGSSPDQRKKRDEDNRPHFAIFASLLVSLVVCVCVCVSSLRRTFKHKKQKVANQR